MTFLEKLDSLKKKHGLNNRTLSINTGIPYTTIDSFYKKGFRNMKFETLEKLACYFHVSLDYLMNEEITTDSNGFDENRNQYLEYIRLESGERETVLSPDEMEIITAYRNIGEGYKKAIQRILRIDKETKESEHRFENLYTDYVKLKSSKE